ncbi:MAG: RluA family pseudouridine synthase [Patescibacteria group bacterium]|jgi:23S rRNA pseudouridine1911/1915/1917 synthase
MKPMDTKIDGLTRLDIAVALSLGVSRTLAQKAIKNGFVLVDGYKRSPHFLVEGENAITYAPEAFEKKIEEKGEIPTLDILYEDDDVLVINKPAGLLVHATDTSTEATLVDAVLAIHPEIIEVGEEKKRAGIVHRLDKGASGVMIIAKTQAAFVHLKDQFKNHLAKKHYVVLATGFFTKPHDTINLPIARSKNSPRMAARPISQGGKTAVTHYTVVQQFPHHALLDVEIESGRTHQIRAHLFAIEHPVVGDKVYRKKNQKYSEFPRIFLHAKTLQITLPSGKEKTFTAPIPLELKTELERIPKI